MMLFYLGRMTRLKKNFYGVGNFALINIPSNQIQISNELVDSMEIFEKIGETVSD